jgi:hypothetical protein
VENIGGVASPVVYVDTSQQPALVSDAASDYY